MGIDHSPPQHETVMDVTEEQIARVYAQAFLGVANGVGKAADLVDELGSFVFDVLGKFPKFEETLDSEFVELEEKQTLLDRVLGGRASVEVLNFLKVLALRGRLGLVRPIARIAKKKYAEQIGQRDVEVRVAREMDDAMQNEILEQLRARLSTEPVMRVVVDPSLIAGIVIRMGDKVFDGSVRSRFDSIRKSMIDHATEAIETGRDRFVSA
jgi:F-type H+-transporting ATPase subunit delta